MNNFNYVAEELQEYEGSDEGDNADTIPPRGQSQGTISR